MVGGEKGAVCVCLICLSCLHVESALSVFRALPAFPTCPCHALGWSPFGRLITVENPWDLSGDLAGRLGCHVAAERT